MTHQNMYAKKNVLLKHVSVFKKFGLLSGFIVKTPVNKIEEEIKI